MRPIAAFLVIFLAVSAHSREPTPQEAQVIDFWNESELALCQEFPRYGIEEWPDFQQRRLIVYGATRERRTETLSCLFGDQDDPDIYFAFTWSPTQGFNGVRLRAALDAKGFDGGVHLQE